MINNFYTYVYLDPRKPGNYNYGKYNFKFEPFYIGKGSNRRIKFHLKDKNKSYKINKIKAILNESLEPITIKHKDNLLECQAFKLEMDMIKNIGRRDLKLGPLTNLTDGGDGSSGRIHTEKTKEKMSDNHCDVVSKNNPMYGKKHTENVKTQLKKSWKERRKTPVSSETKEKMSISRKKFLKNNLPPRTTPVIINEKYYISKADACRQLKLTRRQLDKIILNLSKNENL